MKREDKKCKFLIVAGILILSFLVVLTVFGKKGVLQLENINRKKVALQAEIEQLKEENIKLKEKIRSLRSDSREIEKLARTELGLVKPGEVIYQFIEREDEE